MTRVLLDGGKARVFTADSVDVVALDISRLEDFFSEGLPRDTVTKLIAPLVALVSGVMSMSSEELVRRPPPRRQRTDVLADRPVP